MSVSRILKWVSAALEITLAIPILGASIVLGSGYIVLAIMLVLHIITLILTKRNHGPGIGSIIGIVASCIAWIPNLMIVPHILAAFFLIISAMTPDDDEAEQTS